LRRFPPPVVCDLTPEQTLMYLGDKAVEIEFSSLEEAFAWKAANGQ
jgi:hypothetical protein